MLRLVAQCMYLYLYMFRAHINKRLVELLASDLLPMVVAVVRPAQAECAAVA